MTVNLKNLEHLYREARPAENCSVGQFSRCRDASVQLRNELMVAWPFIHRALLAAQKMATAMSVCPGICAREAFDYREEFQDAMEGR